MKHNNYLPQFMSQVYSATPAKNILKTDTTLSSVKYILK